MIPMFCDGLRRGVVYENDKNVIRIHWHRIDCLCTATRNERRITSEEKSWLAWRGTAT